MPISCSTSVFTGSEGSVWFKPAGTTFCLKDWSDFPAGTLITVPTENDFKINDPVTFVTQLGGSLVTALTANTTYYVRTRTATNISVAATLGGTAITLVKNGGTGSADSPGHIKLSYAKAGAVCQVKTYSIDLTREEIDTTTLPCGLGAASGKYASFRTVQAGFAAGTGSMEVQFTDDQVSLANRLLANSLLRNQEGAEVKLYVNTLDNGSGLVDDANSSFIAAPISIQGMSLNVAPNQPTTATCNFAIRGVPTRMFTTDLT